MDAARELFHPFAGGLEGAVDGHWQRKAQPAHGALGLAHFEFDPVEAPQILHDQHAIPARALQSELLRSLLQGQLQLRLDGGAEPGLAPRNRLGFHAVQTLLVGQTHPLTDRPAADPKEFGNGGGFPPRQPQEQGGNADADPRTGDGIGFGQEGLASEDRKSVV